MMPTLDLARLRQVSVARCKRWHKDGLNQWSLSDWGIAAGGELGEAMNIMKKLNRARDGLVGNAKGEDRETLRQKLADEVADTVIYLDLLLASEGLDLAEAVVSKFNRKSVEVGFPERLELK
jgi:NTP pyrophosphatase (non-canonical NTP hydrolase)